MSIKIGGIKIRNPISSIKGLVGDASGLLKSAAKDLAGLSFGAVSVNKVTKALEKAVSGTAKTAEKAVKQTTKATTKAVKDTGKAIEKGAEVTGKAVAKGATTAVNKAIDVGKNVVDSSVRVVSSVAKGDLLGAAENALNIASGGTVDMTGKKKGIINVNTNKYIAKLFGGVPDMGASGTGAVSTKMVSDTYSKGKSGLLKQLRQSKGAVGGGSYTKVAKNPLGGSSGKTGK